MATVPEPTWRATRPAPDLLGGAKWRRKAAGAERVGSCLLLRLENLCLLLRLENFRGIVSLPAIFVISPDLLIVHSDTRTFIRARLRQVLPDLCRRCAFVPG